VYAQYGQQTLSQLSERSLLLEEEFEGNEGDVYTELSLDCDVTCEENFDGSSGDVYVNNGIGIEVSFETP